MSNFDRQNRYIFAQRRPQSLLGQIIAFVVGVVVLGVSFVFGAFLLTAIFGLVLLVVVAAMIRGWWLRRQMEQTFASGGPGQQERGSRVIDGDYTVIDADSDTGRDNPNR